MSNTVPVLACEKEEAGFQFTFGKYGCGQRRLSCGVISAVLFVGSIGAVRVAVAAPGVEDAVAVAAGELPVLALLILAVLLVGTVGTITTKVQ